MIYQILNAQGAVINTIRADLAFVEAVYPGRFVEVGPDPELPRSRSLTLKQFWQRFTVAEREALMGLIATGTQGQKNKLNAFRDYVQTGMNVELDEDYIIASVTLMETAGILGAGRAVVILT